MRHKTGVAAHLGFAHVAFKFGLGNQRRHGVDNHKVNSAGTHEHVGNIQSLFAVVGLRDEQFVRIDAQALGVGHVKRVFRVNKGAGSAHSLAFGDDVQGKGGFARRFGPENFRYAPTRNAAHSQGQVKTNGTCGNDGYIHMSVVRKLHDSALAVFTFNGGKGSAQGFCARVFRAQGRFFGHSFYAPGKDIFKLIIIAKGRAQGKCSAAVARFAVPPGQLGAFAGFVRKIHSSGNKTPPCLK